MCGGTNDVGQELRSCYNIQIRADYEDVIKGYEENSYYIEVELVQFAPLEQKVTIGPNYVVDLTRNQLVTLKNRALKIYDTKTLALTGQCIVENVSEITYVFKIKELWYLYDKEIGTL